MRWRIASNPLVLLRAKLYPGEEQVPNQQLHYNTEDTVNKNTG